MALEGAHVGSLLLIINVIATGAVDVFCVQSWPVFAVDDGCWY